jgi:putative transposase
VETAGAVEKPKDGFPTAPWTFGPQFPQRRLRLIPFQTQLSFYSPELRELRQLREENSRLKRLVADLSLDRQILQEIVSKKL